MIKVTGLQATTTRLVTSRARGATPFGPRPLDDANVTLCQSRRPRPLRGPHEQKIVKLVEVPLAEQEPVEDPGAGSASYVRGVDGDLMYMYQAVKKPSEHGHEGC